MGRRLLVVAFLASLLPCAPRPAFGVEQARIDRAVVNGVAGLKRMQMGDGSWGGTEVGATALAGLALLECDVPATDRSIVSAAARVRQGSVRSTHTYSIALAILFLDRLDNPADTHLIESLVIRLMMGQTPSGGWQYNCPELDELEWRRLQAAMGGAELKGGRGLPALPEKGKRAAKDLSKEAQLQLNRLLGARRVGGLPMSSDNSNTQFATLGLWVGRRYGVPVNNSLVLVERRFRATQNPDGGWPYYEAGGGPGMAMPATMSGSSATMTCAGLLGLAIGHGVAADAARSRDPKAGPRDISKDANLRAALQALGTAVGNPVGPAGRPASAGGKAYYFLWSVERVGVALGLETIGKKDWYGWGCELLLANQGPDGTWRGEYGENGADTAFALLFLRRANLARDLTGAIRGTDPGSRELRPGGVGGEGLKGGPAAALAPSGIGEKGATTPKVEIPVVKVPPREPTPGTPGATSPPVGPRATPAEGSAAALGHELLTAGEGRKTTLLGRLRDGKGAEYTEALAEAIGRLRGEAKQQARDALAERLARMKASTLRTYLKDEEAEIRRAAAIASAATEDRAFAPDLIRLLSDPEPTVERAALAALRELTGKDLGPAPGATRPDRAKAIAAWEQWWRTQSRE